MHNLEKDIAYVLEGYKSDGIQCASERYCEMAEFRDLKRWEQIAFREACRKAMLEHDKKAVAKAEDRHR